MDGPTYNDPLLTIVVLDFRKEIDTRACLESIRNHIKVPYRLHYLHNGPADHPRRFYDLGLVDMLVQTRINEGLGLGTRALMASVFSPYTLMWQNDQIAGRDLEQEELDGLIAVLNRPIEGIPNGYSYVGSVSLAGPVGGENVYSERVHIVKTGFYRYMETLGVLPVGGAGPWHHLIWREEAIQRHYRHNRIVHVTDWPPLVIDNGKRATRQNSDGSIWEHEPDTKRLWLLEGPVIKRYVYPKFSDREWTLVLQTQNWPAGQIPELEIKDSFVVPHWHK